MEVEVEVEVEEAQARLAELLDKVEGGEIVRVTREGRPAVRLVLDEEARRARIEEAVARIEALRKSLKGRYPPTSIDDIIAMKNEGRRY